MDVKFTTVKEIYKDREAYIGKTITVGGWVRSIRASKTFGFLVLHDGTFFETLQVVFGEKLSNFADICRFNVGSAVIVTGELVATPAAKQPFEIQAAEVVLEGASTPDYPMQKERARCSVRRRWIWRMSRRTRMEALTIRRISSVSLRI